MRQAGTLPTESEAHRFAAWLVTQGMEAHAEQEPQGWVIWVRDEDKVAQARESLAHFQANPLDPRYRGAESAAAARRREEDRRRDAAQKNVVEMRGRWAGSAGGAVMRRCPLVLAIIATCILVGVATDSLRGGNPVAANARSGKENTVLMQLLFTDPRAILTKEGVVDVWASIRSGEVWRLVTPIFVHFGLTHLLFNMLWLFDLGGQVETRRGTWYMLALVLTLAILSNVGQAVEASLAGGAGFRFGGMSGVVYGLIGYVLIKVKFDNSAGYSFGPVGIFISLLWFVLCIARDFPPFDVILAPVIPKIANSAHAVGLFVGMAIAYAPLALRRAPS